MAGRFLAAHDSTCIFCCSSQMHDACTLYASTNPPSQEDFLPNQLSLLHLTAKKRAENYLKSGTLCKQAARNRTCSFWSSLWKRLHTARLCPDDGTIANRSRCRTHMRILLTGTRGWGEHIWGPQARILALLCGLKRSLAPNGVGSRCSLQGAYVQ